MKVADYVQLEPAVEVHVRPEQRGQCPPVGVSERVGPLLVGEDLLYQQHVDMREGALEQAEGEQGHLRGLLVRPGQISVLALEELLVRAVPVLHDLQALMGLLPKFDIGEAVADERRAHRPPEFLDRLMGGVHGSAAGEMLAPPGPIRAAPGRAGPVG